MLNALPRPLALLLALAYAMRLGVCLLRGATAGSGCGGQLRVNDPLSSMGTTTRGTRPSSRYVLLLWFFSNRLTSLASLSIAKSHRFASLLPMLRTPNELLTASPPVLKYAGQEAGEHRARVVPFRACPLRHLAKRPLPRFDQCGLPGKPLLSGEHIGCCSRWAADVRHSRLSSTPCLGRSRARRVRHSPTCC